MGLRGIRNVDEYASVLATERKEADALFKDLLIGVTEFFRDPIAWETMDAQVIAPLVESKAAGEPIRVWVAGCATGEEAYSVAMLDHGTTRERRQAVPAPGVRDRFERRRTRDRPRRGVPRGDHCAGVCRAAAPPLPPRSPTITTTRCARNCASRSSSARTICWAILRFEDGRGDLPQPADLSRAGSPAESRPSSAFCAAPRRPSLPGSRGNDRQAWGPVRTRLSSVAHLPADGTTTTPRELVELPASAGALRVAAGDVPHPPAPGATDTAAVVQRD